MADKKEIRDRAFAMSGAILFFVTSIALTVVVIVQLVQESKQKKEDSKTAATTQQTQEGKLAGTKLAGFTAGSDVPELVRTDLTEGSGKEVTSVENKVTVDYTGALVSDGTIFESSLDSGEKATFTLNGVIKGWQDGMIGMKEGGKRRLLIPSADAYGPSAQNGIPANSDLVFDITLHKVE